MAFRIRQIHSRWRKKAKWYQPVMKVVLPPVHFEG